MPLFLDARDLRLLIGAAGVMVLLLGLTYALSPPPAQQSLGYPSSYSSDGGGAKAAFLLLQKLGYRVERWDESPEELPVHPNGDVLILAQPFQAGSSSEIRALRNFVSAGGRVLAIGAAAANLAPGAAAKEIVSFDPRAKTYSVLVPSPLTNGAPEITMVAPDAWTSSDPSQLGVYGDEADPVVVSYRIGAGDVIWWASDSPLTNGAIRDKGNLALFLNSVGPRSASTVFWDEYYHGERGTLASYFAKTPLPWAGLQIAVVFIAIMFTFSRRAGPARIPATESRLSPLEFVDTLGGLYSSAHATPTAVGVAYKRFRFLLSRKLSLSSVTKLPDLSRTASVRFGWPEEALLDTLSRSERAMRSISLQESEALYLVRELHGYSADLGPQGRIQRETPAWR
jgi:hypothetical protein